MRNKIRSFFHKYDAELERLIVDSSTLLDVGCGSSSPIRIFSHKLHTEGVDAFIPSIEKSKFPYLKVSREEWKNRLIS